MYAKGLTISGCFSHPLVSHIHVPITFIFLTSSPLLSLHVYAQTMILSTEDWDFDLVEVQRVTKNHPLVFVGVTLFRKYDLPSKFKIPTNILTNFFKVVEAAYNDKPYHNSTHAADVMRTAHYFISRGGMQVRWELGAGS